MRRTGKIFTYLGKGSRERQEDALLVRKKGQELLIAVADGMGGLDKGELASRIAVENLERNFLERGRIEEYENGFFQRSFNEICRLLLKESGFLGSTIAAAVIARANGSFKMFFSWLGDTRIYLYTKEPALIKRGIPLPENKEDGRLWLLTRDHTLVWELYEKGKISFSEIQSHPERGGLLAGLHPLNQGVYEETYTVTLKEGDRILICSDGVWEIPGFHRFLAKALRTSSLEKAYRKLVKFLQKKEKKLPAMDNNSLILVEVCEELFNKP